MNHRALGLSTSAGTLLLALLAMPSAGARAPQAQSRFDQVLAPSALLHDARLDAPHDLNRPYAFRPRFASWDEWLARRAALRQQVLVAEGLVPMPERMPLHPVIHGRVERDGYTIENVYFASYPGFYVTGNLYRPKGAATAVAGKYPAVLTPYGHWKDGRFFTRTDEEAQRQIEKGAEKTLESAKYPEQARCAMLARLGYVVFHYDMVGYADSQQIEHRQGFADPEAELRLQSFMGLQTWNSLRALDFLLSLPDVDPTRVGVTGASGGGTQTIILDAIDDRPAVAFPAVMVSGAMQGGCICENAWGLRVGTNNIELAAMFAPKPMGMSAANDWTKDIMTLGLPELKAIYRLHGAEDMVIARYFSFEHNFNQVSREVMYDWFDTHLSLRHPVPAREQPFVPALRPELTVFDEAHPRPKDATDAAGLRAEMTRLSDAQMTALARNPAAYRETVGEALRAIVNDPIPKPGTVRSVPETDRELQGAGFVVHQDLLTRRGSAEVLPMISLRPASSGSSSAVIWAHPDGKRSLFMDDGVTPAPAVRWLLDRGVSVVAPDVFLTGEFQRSASPARRPYIKDQEKFSGYNDGYNRTVLANRVRDLLTLVAFLQSSKASSIHLVAFDRAGVWALLARALAGDAIGRASIDLGGFDFTQIREPDDEMMLPGGLKYGGLLGFAPLFATSAGATELYRAPTAPASWVAASNASFARLLGPRTTIHAPADSPPPEQMVRWLLQQPERSSASNAR